MPDRLISPLDEPGDAPEDEEPEEEEFEEEDVDDPDDSGNDDTLFCTCLLQATNTNNRGKIKASLPTRWNMLKLFAEHYSRFIPNPYAVNKTGTTADEKVPASQFSITNKIYSFSRL